MSAIIFSGDPYDLFVHLGHQLARLEDRASQSKIWQLFSSVMETSTTPMAAPTAVGNHAYDISDPKIPGIAAHLNAIVTHLLQATQAPQSHLLDSFTFNAQCLAIVQNLQEQLRAQRMAPDATVAQLESSLIALSEKWLHYLIEEPEKFFEVVKNPATFTLAISFLGRKWNVLTQFLGSGMSPVQMPAWPPSQDAFQCFAEFQKYQALALAKGKALSDRCDMLQPLFELSALESAIPQTQMTQIRQRLDQTRALLVAPTRMDEEGLKFLGTTFRSLSEGAEQHLKVLAQKIRETVTELEEGIRTGKRIDQVRLGQIQTFLQSIPPVPPGEWMSSVSVPDVRTWLPYISALFQMRSQYFYEMNSESLTLLRQLRASLPTDMYERFSTLLSEGERLESQTTGPPAAPISSPDFVQTSIEFQRKVSSFEAELISAFSRDLGVSVEIGEKIFRGAQNNWKGFFVELEDGILQQTHDIPHLKIVKIPGTNQLAAEYGLRDIGSGTYKRAKEILHFGVGSFVRLTSSSKRREREIQTQMQTEQDPAQRQKLQDELWRLQQGFLDDIQFEAWARERLTGVPNIAGMTMVRYWSRPKPDKPSRLKTRYIMTKYEGTLLSLAVNSKDAKSRVQALECCRGVFRCLSEMHRLGYIHGDLKLANVLFSGNTGFVSDFGLFSANSATLDYTGNLAYMAPETVFRSSNPRYTPEMDLFSLGILLLGIADPSRYRTWEKDMVMLQDRAAKVQAWESSYLTEYEKALRSGHCSLSVSQVESKLRWISGEKSEARKKQEQITMDVKAISEYEEDLLKRGSSLTVDELAQGKNRIDERKKEISIRQANLDRESWLLSRYEQDLLGGSYSMPLHEIERTIERIPERRRASKEALHAEFQKRYCESLAMLQEGLGGETSRFNPLIRRLISYNPDARRTCAEAETEFTTLFPPTVDQP